MMMSRPLECSLYNGTVSNHIKKRFRGSSFNGGGALVE